ncbi:inner membrane-spanning protein YciB [Cochlodiniinecator piscidefendens]|uniref:inner membrane-spanning protein YciB n=1 Tax=Cochlodiniinecator piscidefendens TaxID=2715756 RepID=UPI00140A3A63|nr:inner membrane-spanning protein YciB [Cochlodiniinecator piscidefendens]
MSEKQVSPTLRGIIEYGPLIAFFVGYMRLKGDVVTFNGVEYEGLIVATALFIPLLLLSTGLLWWLTGALSKMQIMTALLVVVMGGMTIWLNDSRFFKMKPTILYVFFGGALTFGLMRGQSYLKFLMGEMLPLKNEGWMILTKRLAIFFFALAVANEFVWRTMSDTTWVTFKVVGLTLALFGFFMSQVKLFHVYGEEKGGE